MLLGYIVIFSIIGGIAGLFGAALVVFKLLKTREQSLHLVSFAAGALLAAAFFDLIPESIAIAGNASFSLSFVLAGIILFYCLEKFLIWEHCHRHSHGVICEVHTSGRMIIIGDSLHNFLDGAAIAAAFLVSIPLGIVTSIAVFLHEIPQEIGDFGVLVHGGFSHRAAIFWNLISAFFCLLGSFLTYFLVQPLEMAESFLVAIVAGGFIYIATSDLLPEIHRHLRKRYILSHTLLFLFGILVMWLVGEWLHV